MHARSRSTFVGFVALVASAAAVWFGCVGQDPDTTSGVQADPNAADGDYRGKCNDGRCLSNLECIQGVCLYPDGGGPPATSSSGGSSSGGSSSGSSSSGASTRAPCPMTLFPPGAVPCQGAADGGTNQCSNGETCCVTASGQLCTTSTGDCTVLSGNNKPFRCGTSSACNGQTCCLKGVPSSIPDVCPVVLGTSDVTGSDCQPFCLASDRQLCDNDNQCGAPAKCVQLKMTVPPQGAHNLGICL